MGNNCCAATSNFETTAAAENGQKPLRTELQQPLRSPEQLLVEELRQAKSFPSSSRSSEFLLKSAPPGTKGDLEFVNHTFPCLAPYKDQGNCLKFYILNVSSVFFVFICTCPVGFSNLARSLCAPLSSTGLTLLVW
jgi:hypothetical protein